MYSVIIEAGNCMYCGKHIDNSGSIFLCEECRRKEEERTEGKVKQMSLINKEDLMQTLGITDMDCEKCGWYSRTARKCKRGSDFEDACFAIDNAPEVKPEPQWIPVSERLPEDDAQVLCTDSEGFVYIAWHCDYDIIEKTKCWYDVHYCSLPEDDIIAWMPLPEPWRGEKHES